MFGWKLECLLNNSEEHSGLITIKVKLNITYWQRLKTDCLNKILNYLFKIALGSTCQRLEVSYMMYCNCNTHIQRCVKSLFYVYGLSRFLHSFVIEVLAIVHAHVTALGGNAMVEYYMSECVLYHNAHKKQIRVFFYIID